MAAIFSRFTVLCLSSYFAVYFFKSKLILFHNRIIYYSIRIFLILLPPPVCDDIDETVNPINEYSKLAQKEYKSRYDYMGKVIFWELCKKVKFDHANKWYRHKVESVLENKMYKILKDFEIQMDHAILARRPDLELIDKKITCQLLDLVIPVD